MGFVSWVERRQGRLSPAEEDWLANSGAHNAGAWGGFAAGLIIPFGPGKVKAGGQLLNVSVRGTKGYAQDLFRMHAGGEALKVMRDRGSNRIVGVRTVSGNVLYRPKFGSGGVISNVEIINSSGVRINIHVRP